MWTFRSLHSHTQCTDSDTHLIALWQSSASLRGVWTLYRQWHTLIYSSFTIVLVTADKSDPNMNQFHKGSLLHVGSLVFRGKSLWRLPLSTILTPSNVWSACTFNYGNPIGDCSKLVTNNWCRLGKEGKWLCLLDLMNRARLHCRPIVCHYHMVLHSKIDYTYIMCAGHWETTWHYIYNYRILKIKLNRCRNSN